MELYGAQQQENWVQEPGPEESVPRWNSLEGEVYPERPGLPDCAYYMRTGSCSYGAKCRYNHPRDRIPSFGGAEYPERIGEPPCQFFLKTGTCKFGSSCKFNHPKNAGGLSINAPLNIQGYPIRPGDRECSYYLKTGQCKFGATCKFHHPQPAGNTPLPAASARPFFPTVQSLSSPIEQYRVARPPTLLNSYAAGAYGPMMLHPGVIPFPNWNPYQGQVSPSPSPGLQPQIRAPSVYGMSQAGSSIPVFPGTHSQVPLSDGLSGSIAKENRYPERPGEPDCKYYIRTGDCKYGPSCKYNHPPNWAASMSDCALNPLGLPLRPGVEACSFYLQRGQCKFGVTCKFDHPVANINYSEVTSYTEIPG